VKSSAAALFLIGVMAVPLADQIVAFLWTLGIGMTAGLCHVIYRAISDTLRLKKVGTFAGDLVFWIVLTVISFYVLLRANYGQLRLYVFIGLLLGAFLFTHFLGRHSYRLARWLLRAGAWVAGCLAMLMGYAWKLISLPFKIVFITAVFPVRLSARALGGVGNFAGRVIGKPFRRFKVRITSWLGSIRAKP